ncbi:hypothetical protein FCN77_15330 [Arthrobacter sp. 24S4-2]|nr:hypothetical protein FCN77_15330 [Arthrobacter sp. 24S4-2]
MPAGHCAGNRLRERPASSQLPHKRPLWNVTANDDGGTAQVAAGLGDGTPDGATKQGTVTAGEYTAARGPGGR